MSTHRRAPNTAAPWKWPAVMFVLAMSMTAWAVVWQYYLLDAFTPDPSASATVFVDDSGNRRVLWGSSGAGFVVASLGVLFWALANRFRRHSAACRRIVVICGAALILVGVSCLLLFVSVRSVVIDERARLVVFEQRWLYVQKLESLAFDDIARVNLRVRRTRVGGASGGCLVAQGLSIIRHDRTWVEVPFKQEEIGREVAHIADVPLEGTDKREC